MDDDWSPPTEEEMKVMEARRARSDLISKLMSGYLLKGYKMLGTECSICGTILLQDRASVKHCVACEELECDTEKDNPALRPPGAPSQSIKDEIRASTTPHTTALTTSASYSSKVRVNSPRVAATNSPRTNGIMSDPHLGRPVHGEDGAVAEYLSMSSIDVHCWPANSVELGAASGAGGDQANSKKVVHGSATISGSTAGVAGSGPSGIPSSTVPQPQTSPADITSCIAALQAKICWAGQTLEQNKCVDSSTELCKLIKAAAEAIVAVRKASI